jgi:hypothetical protein
VPCTSARMVCRDEPRNAFVVACVNTASVAPASTRRSTSIASPSTSPPPNVRRHTVAERVPGNVGRTKRSGLVACTLLRTVRPPSNLAATVPNPWPWPWPCPCSFSFSFSFSFSLSTPGTLARASREVNARPDARPPAADPGAHPPDDPVPKVDIMHLMRNSQTREALDLQAFRALPLRTCARRVRPARPARATA